jgi:O-antigen/teichoic acid export membrane protein
VKLSLDASFSWSFVGSGLYAATQWAMLVALAQLGSAATVGQFTYALAVTAPIVMLIGGRNVQVTDVERSYSTGEYLSQRLVGAALTTCVIAIIAWWLPVDSVTMRVVLLVGVAKGVEAIADVFHGLFHRRQRLDIVTRSLLVRGIATVSGFTATYYLTEDLVTAVAALAVVWALALLLYDLKVARRYQDESLRLARRGVKLFRLTLPLGVASALASLSMNIPRYAIEASVGQEALGVFSALAYVLVAGRTMAKAIHQAILPALATHLSAGNTERYWRLARRSIVLCLGLGALSVFLAVAVGEPVLRIVYGDIYAKHHLLFTWIVVAGAVSYPGWVLLAALSAAQSFRSETVAHLVSLAAVGVSSWVLIPTRGLFGAVWVLGIAYGTQLLVRAVALHRISRVFQARVASTTSSSPESGSI